MENSVVHSKGYELSKKYYPTYWGIERLIKLVELEKLFEDEYLEITGFIYPNTSKVEEVTENIDTDTIN